jgi:hypothetical protein
MIPRTAISLARQGRRLLEVCPGSQVTIRRSCLTWVGRLQPTPISADYELGLEYRLPRRPQVHVLSPVLKWRGREPPPHLFQNNCLCLYHSPSREWHAGMMMGNTVIPWASEWLLHHELWRATGVWCGGGIHPGSLDESRR